MRRYPPRRIPATSISSTSARTRPLPAGTFKVVAAAATALVLASCSSDERRIYPMSRSGIFGSISPVRGGFLVRFPDLHDGSHYVLRGAGGTCWDPALGGSRRLVAAWAWETQGGLHAVVPRKAPGSQKSWSRAFLVDLRTNAEVACGDI